MIYLLIPWKKIKVGAGLYIILFVFFDFSDILRSHENKDNETKNKVKIVRKGKSTRRIVELTVCSVR